MKLKNLAKNGALKAFSDMMMFDVIHCKDGECVVELDIQDFHKQRLGFVHGGVLLALMDHVGGSAALSLCEGNDFFLTADINVSYLRPGLPPRIRIIGKVIKTGSQLCFVDVKVYNLSPKEVLCTIGRLTMSRQKIHSVAPPS